MTTDAIPSNSDLAASLAIESDELHQPQIEAFIARNRKVSNKSIRQSRAERAQGVVSNRTIQDIIADALRRYGKS